MYYRRKLTLALLQKFGGTLGKTSFQKLMLLLTKQQERPDYHFVPYKYGCFSFQAMADISTMEKYEQVAQDSHGIRKTDTADYIIQLKENDQKALNQLFLLHGKKNYKDLIKYTYNKYPFYAINSEIADRYLTEDDLKIVRQHRPQSNHTILYTIGYEGITLEEYLNKLIVKDVKVLVDVRNNPLSMKYGFSKSQLVNSCRSVGIEYIHIPEVGIVSEQRQELKSQKDYDNLFAKYCQVNLPSTLTEQKQILQLLKSKARIALTCFEANICQCHRKHLAEAITRLPQWNYELIHL
ncbi:DUF488 domain-containing protein [Chitinophaga sp. 180180018-2]|nr:DUF488 domain-containing protein [Chitinophaga sp. 212800010-3]